MEKELNEDTLQTIENCGAVEMPLEETLEIAEITQAQYDASKCAAKRYRLGQLKTKMAVRQAIVQGAKSGNGQSVKDYQQFAAENQYDSNSEINQLLKETS